MKFEGVYLYPQEGKTFTEAERRYINQVSAEVCADLVNFAEEGFFCGSFDMAMRCYKFINLHDAYWKYLSYLSTKEKRCDKNGIPLHLFSNKS
jgi:hypothetical protein